MWRRQARTDAALGASAAPEASLAGASAAGSRGRAERLLARLEWTVLRRLDGMLQGEHRSLLRGAGLDLADLREYRFGDDVRHIDWNLTARFDTPYVRQYIESREIDAWFLVDLSASLAFGSGTVSKRELARDFTAVLARLLARQGNRVGAALYLGGEAGAKGATVVMPARPGREQVLGLLHRLDGPAVAASRAPARATTKATTRATDLAAFLGGTLAALKRRALVFIVSDFESLPGWEAPLGRLATRHETIAVRVVDPLERFLPDLGILPIQDAETGEQILVDTHDAAFRRRFAEGAARHDAALEASFARAGVDVLELATDEDLADAVVRFARLRAMSRRTANGGVR